MASKEEKELAKKLKLEEKEKKKEEKRQKRLDKKKSAQFESIEKVETPKKRKINFHRIYLVFVVIIFGVFIYLYATHIYNDFFKKEEVPEVIEEEKLEEIKGYGYTLGDRDTELYKTHFETLNEILNSEEINYEEYAKELVSLFIIDFYSLSTHVSSTDVGGIEFLYPKGVDNFLINAQENMYKSVQSDFGNRTQKLPTVSDVTIKSIAEQSKLAYGKKNYKGYKITASWEYVEDMGYEKSGTFYVINIDNKLYVYSKTGSY